MLDLLQVVPQHAHILHARSRPHCGARFARAGTGAATATATSNSAGYCRINSMLRSGGASSQASYSHFMQDHDHARLLDRPVEVLHQRMVLGQPCEWLRTPTSGSPRLPCVTELFPELLDAPTPEDHQPSCSVRMALASQGLFVDDVAVRFAAQLLYELFSTGRLSAHGVVVHPASKRSGPLEVDPRTWARFGFRHPEPSESLQSVAA